jgi:hypothetical protein
MNKIILFIICSFLFTSCIAREIDMLDNKGEVIMNSGKAKEDKPK